MISILIPTYNRNCFALAAELSRQLVEGDIQGEVIVMDDGSTNLYCKTENKKISTLPLCRYIEQERNQGCELTRQALAKEAKHDLFLFVDADTFPKDKNFVANYVKASRDNFAVSGGLLYRKSNGMTKISPLRYVYGKYVESHSASWRRAHRPTLVFGGNFVVTRYIFEKVSLDGASSSYGYEELLISKAISDANVKLCHIDNPVYHDDDQTSEQFLSKTRCAVENLSRHAVEYYDHSRLLQFHIIMERLGLCWFFARMFRMLSFAMERNLKSKYPSVILFQLYKLGYYCCISRL
jgi:glycosyltransferase involved in cell wall biosynthesis